MSDNRGMNPILGYTFCGLMSVCGGLLIYGVLKSTSMEFSANWNMFDSILMWPLYIIGLVVMFANWNSINNYIVIYRLDISNVFLYEIVLPFLIRFVGVPLVVAAIIYYPLQCVIALVGAIFPWIVTLIIVGIIVGFWIWNNNSDKDPIKFSAACVLLTICFGVGAYFMWPASTSDFSTLPSTEKTSTSDPDPDGGEFNYDDSDFD